MAKFNRFSYWKQGINLKKRPKTKNLFELIQSGYFDESPYWQMYEKNLETFESEKSDWLAKNKNVSKKAFNDWQISRRRVWNLQNEKLKQLHQDQEIRLLEELKQEFKQVFGFDDIFSSYENDELTILELFKKAKENKHGNKQNNNVI